MLVLLLLGYGAAAQTVDTAQLANSLLAYWPLDRDDFRVVSPRLSWPTPKRHKSATTDSHGNRGSLSLANDAYLELGELPEELVDNGLDAFSMSVSFRIDEYRHKDACVVCCDKFVKLRVKEKSNDQAQLEMGLHVDGHDKKISSSNYIDWKKWVHVLTTFDGSTIRLYVNGELTDSRDERGAVELESKKLYVGGKNKYLEGNVDELAMYKRALTAAEVAFVFKNGVVAPGFAVATTTQCPQGLPKPDCECGSNCQEQPHGAQCYCLWNRCDLERDNKCSSSEPLQRDCNSLAVVGDEFNSCLRCSWDPECTWDVGVGSCRLLDTSPSSSMGDCAAYDTNSVLVDCDELRLADAEYGQCVQCYALDVCDALFMFTAHTTSVNWDTAAAACGAGAQLASVHTEEHQDQLVQLANNKELWIGLRNWPTGTFWSDGTPFVREHWLSGEPNESNACGRVKEQGWADRDCSLSFGYLCRVRDPGATPQPTPPPSDGFYIDIVPSNAVVTMEGSWKRLAMVPGFFGEDAYMDADATKNGQTRVSVAVANNVLAAARPAFHYEVLMWWPPPSRQDRYNFHAVMARLVDGNGAQLLHTQIDQNVDGGQWHSLGSAQEPFQVQFHNAVQGASSGELSIVDALYLREVTCTLSSMTGVASDCVTCGAGALQHVCGTCTTGLFLTPDGTCVAGNIQPKTLRAFNASPPSPLPGRDYVDLAGVVTWGKKVAFDGQGFVLDPATCSASDQSGCPVVRFKSPSDSWFACVVDPALTSFSTITCTVKAVGRDLVVVAQLPSGDSVSGVDRLHTVAPAITPGTLRPVYTHLDTTGSGNSLFQSTTTSGQAVSFVGTSFGSYRDLITVTYGPASHPHRYTCRLTTVKGSDGVKNWKETNTNGKIVCLTASGEGEREALMFTVSVAGQTATGTDVYRYALGSAVTRVSGCTDVGAGTEHCPTSGQDVVLSVFGQDFRNGSVVTVGGKGCAVVAWTSTQLNCTLPPGAGSRRGVVVSYDNILSPTARLVSYAPPSLTTLQGCESGVVGKPHSIHSTIWNCSREGGQRISIFGSNFGPDGAVVLISGQVCSQLIHLGHSKLSCSLPASWGHDLRLEVLQKGGQIGNDTLLVSYASCLRGSFVQGIECPPCPPGGYSDELNSQACTPCPPGRFTDAVGQTQCAFCRAGFYPSLPKGSMSCLPCDKGKYSSSGQTSCLPCEPGKFAPDTGMSSCLPAAPGNFSNEPGATQQQQCSPGFYTPVEEQSVCLPCPEGAHAEMYGTSTCRPCPLGSYSGPGQATCAQCLPGQYNSAEGQIRCSECTPGYFSNSTGAEECTPCPSGTFQTRASSTTCQPCTPGTASGRRQGLTSVCSACERGYYSNEWGLSECRPCPENTRWLNETHCEACPSHMWQPLQGQLDCVECRSAQFLVWSQDTGASCHACPQNAACENGQVQSTEGYWLTYTTDKQGRLPGNVSVAEVKTLECLHGYCMGDNQCGLNRLQQPDNVLCGECAPGAKPWGHECVPQTECSEYRWVIAVGLLACLLFVLLSHFALRALFAWEVANNMVNHGKWGLVLYYSQMVSLFIGMDYGWTKWLGLFNLDLMQYLGSNCIWASSPLNHHFMRVYVPLVCASLLLLTAALHKAWGRCRGSGFDAKPYVRTATVYFLMSYSSVAWTAVSFFRCREVNGVQVMTTLPSVRCSDGDWWFWLAFHLVCLAVVVAVPLAVLLTVRRKLANKTLYHLPALATTGVFFEAFSPDSYYWGVVQLLQRFVLVVVDVLFFAQRSTRYSALSTANAIILAMHFGQKPYARRGDNWMGSVTLFLLTLTTVFLSITNHPISAPAQVAFAVLFVALPVVVLFLWAVLWNLRMNYVSASPQSFPGLAVLTAACRCCFWRAAVPEEPGLPLQHTPQRGPSASMVLKRCVAGDTPAAGVETDMDMDMAGGQEIGRKGVPVRDHRNRDRLESYSSLSRRSSGEETEQPPPPPPM